MVHMATCELRLVDLDWSGVDGVARYPARMNRQVPWPVGADSGLVLQQAHDKDMLQRLLQELRIVNQQAGSLQLA